MKHPCKNNQVIDPASGDILLEDMAQSADISEVVDTGDAVVGPASDLTPGTACSTCTPPAFTSAVKADPQGQCWGAIIDILPFTYSGTEPIAVSYQWYRDEDPIIGETGASYQSIDSDAGHDISCTVSLENGCGFAEASSNAIWDLQSVPTNIGAPIIAAPSTNIGDPITVTSPGVWANGTAAYTYQWYRDGVVIPLATSSTYNITADDFGKRITCNVTDSNDCGQSLPSTSNTIIIPIP